MIKADILYWVKRFCAKIFAQKAGIMIISKILHLCTRNFYKDFSNQPSSQKILKVALPLVSLAFVGLAFTYFFKRQFTTTPATESLLIRAERDQKEKLLKQPVPEELYTGVCQGADRNMLQIQAHRWSLSTNLQTLVRLSTGKAYPANQIRLGDNRAAVSYIMAESPLNNGTVDWQQDYYRMAIETDAALLLSVASPFKNGDINQLHTEQYHFVTQGNPIQFDNYTIQCLNPIPIQINNLYFAYALKVTKNGKFHKFIWQLLPREAPGSSFEEIQAVVNMVNNFVKIKNIALDSKHPLLVNCRTGIDRTGRFVLFHDLQVHLEHLIHIQLRNPHLTDQTIMDAILGTQDISEMLIQRALVIEYSSTATAAIDAIRDSVLSNFNGSRKCTPGIVNAIYREHVLETIKNLRTQRSV